MRTGFKFSSYLRRYRIVEVSKNTLKISKVLYFLPTKYFFKYPRNFSCFPHLSKHRWNFIKNLTRIFDENCKRICDENPETSKILLIGRANRSFGKIILMQYQLFFKNITHNLWVLKFNSTNIKHIKHWILNTHEYQLRSNSRTCIEVYMLAQRLEQWKGEQWQ